MYLDNVGDKPQTFHNQAVLMTALKKSYIFREKINFCYLCNICKVLSEK